jgi:hypothetical protein|uniref:Uncharacterized protein n=1 Tax=CrAss-like virus sp. ctt4r3 TaxID=2823619 RepID=A0A8S5L7R3_9CAUD|nr:MAG TPA: hypothetical protein [CrAss-like virus sp. ctt4r3]
MKNNISYNTIEGVIVADIKPVKSKHVNHGFRVAQFDKTGRFLTLYASAKDASIAIAKEKKTDFSKSIYAGIIKACTPNSNLKTIYGYQWRYVNENGDVIKRKSDE